MLTDQIIACAISVHKELGPGFLESFYEEAVAIELSRQQISYHRQWPVNIHFKGVVIGTHRMDLIVDNKVVVELKAVKDIDDAHLATCLSYLKATRLQVGLIINFSAAKIRIRRVIRTELTGRVDPTLAGWAPRHTVRADFPHTAFADVLVRGITLRDLVLKAVAGHTHLNDPTTGHL